MNGLMQTVYGAVELYYTPRVPLQLWWSRDSDSNCNFKVSLLVIVKLLVVDIFSYIQKTVDFSWVYGCPETSAVLRTARFAPR